MNKLFPLKNEAVVFSLIIRGCNILLGIAIVPVLIASVGLEGYGWWVSIYAVVSWNGLFDLGLNNGFRIKGAEQVFQSHSHGWRRIASNTLVLMGGMALVVVSLNIMYFLIKAIVGMGSPLDLSYFMMILLVGLNQFLRFGTSAASIFGKPYFDADSNYHDPKSGSNHCDEMTFVFGQPIFDNQDPPGYSYTNCSDPRSVCVELMPELKPWAGWDWYWDWY